MGVTGRNYGLTGDEAGDAAVELLHEEALAADREKVQRTQKQLAEREVGRLQRLQQRGLRLVGVDVLRDVVVGDVDGQVHHALRVVEHLDAARVCREANQRVPPVTLPISMKLMRSRSQICCRSSTFSFFTSTHTFSWYSAPQISRADRESSPRTILSRLTRTPLSTSHAAPPFRLKCARQAVISFMMLLLPPAPWLKMLMMGFF